MARQRKSDPEYSRFKALAGRVIRVPKDEAQQMKQPTPQKKPPPKRP